MQLKEAIVRPTPKTSSLDFEHYSNFQPISNLKVMSKILEKAVARQLEDHLSDNNLNKKSPVGLQMFP